MPYILFVHTKRIHLGVSKAHQHSGDCFFDLAIQLRSDKSKDVVLFDTVGVHNVLSKRKYDSIITNLKVLIPKLVSETINFLSSTMG